MIVLSGSLILLFPILLIYFNLSGTRLEETKNMMSLTENLVWIIGSLITIYTTYVLGMKSTGGFNYFYMFFHFAVIFAFVWKVLGLIDSYCPVPYSIREILETMFGVLAIMSVIVLRKMLIKLSKQIA